MSGQDGAPWESRPGRKGKASLYLRLGALVIRAPQASPTPGVFQLPADTNPAQPETPNAKRNQTTNPARYRLSRAFAVRQRYRVRSLADRAARTSQNAGLSGRQHLHP